MSLRFSTCHLALCSSFNVTRRQLSDSRSWPRLTAPSDRLRAIYITVAFAPYLLRQLSHIGFPIIASKPSFRPAKDITSTSIGRPPADARRRYHIASPPACGPVWYAVSLLLLTSLPLAVELRRRFWYGKVIPRRSHYYLCTSHAADALMACLGPPWARRIKRL